MSKQTFILISILYYFISMAVLVVVLELINRKEKNKLKKEINELEREKNGIISANILTELNKVEALVKNDDLKNKYDNWKQRFEDIKLNDLALISDNINEIDTYFLNKEYKNLKPLIMETEMQINNLKTKTSFLLEEIKEITLSEERNRETITKLKADYREILEEYKENEIDYEIIKKPLDLQIENADKLFLAFEKSMEENEYTEVGKIVKAIDDLIKNLKVAITETKPIISLGKNIIPKKIEEITLLEKKMTDEGYNLEYLNIDYNKEEAEKKIIDIFQRLNVLNYEDSLFELKTMFDYFESLFSDFEKEKSARKSFEELSRSILLKSAKLEKINNEIVKKLNDIRYSYDLSDDDINVITEIKEELSSIRENYDRLIEVYRSKIMAYTRLDREMELLNIKLLKTEEKLSNALKTLGGLKEDEKRAREQFEEIKNILYEAKEKVKSYKLPIIPKNYYVELSEAMEAINLMKEELDQRPISIKNLNTRVDTARDLVLKVYNTINETVKTAKMAESAIVYGNRYRPVNKEVDIGLIKAENSFYKGNFKNSLENAINAINIVEPGIYKKLLEEYK